MKIFDAHTHADFITPNFQSDVVGALCCAVNESGWGKIADLINSDNRLYGAFGIHPWYIDTLVPGFDKRLESVLLSGKNRMVGEIGIDKYRPFIDVQIRAFAIQFDIAVKLKRIVCLHCVGAWDKIMHVFGQYKKSEMPIIIAHNFNANDDITEKLLQYETIYFSFGKNIMRGKNRRIEQIPMDKILVETDGHPDVLLADVLTQISKIKNNPNAPEIIYNNMLKVLSDE